MKNYQKAIAAALLVLAAISVIVWWSRFEPDFWPPDRSAVGPNLVASVVQWAILLIVGALLYPPTRRAVERFTQRHVDALKAHVTAEHKKVHDRLDDLHSKIDQVHQHLGIEEEKK